MYPQDLLELPEMQPQSHIMCRGGSAIVSPMGRMLAGPLFDEEGILTAELDMSAIARSKFDFDVVGHYARPDVFQLIVNESPQKSVLGAQHPPKEQLA
jgi:nitrilase